jgi:hypothetical protein
MPDSIRSLSDPSKAASRMTSLVSEITYGIFINRLYKISALLMDKAESTVYADTMEDTGLDTGYGILGIGFKTNWKGADHG